MSTTSEFKSAKNFRVPKELIARKVYQAPSATEKRTDFMRDRDRILYSTAFRRLAGKTQIYTVGVVDDHRKTRLTHTLEVAQIARTIARSLGLDENLAEAIALGHDLGHTPFGHAGEEMLHKIMSEKSQEIDQSPFKQIDDPQNTSTKINFSEYFKRVTEAVDPKYAEEVERILGFKHNIHSVRVAAKLEDSYRDENKLSVGLNLTNFSLYGMMIHSGLDYGKKELKQTTDFRKEFDAELKLRNCRTGEVHETDAWSFEAFVVEWADDIAQWHHDLEDALLDGVMPLEVICETIKDALKDMIVRQGQENRLKELDEIKENGAKNRHNATKLTSIVVDTLVRDLVDTTLRNFENLAGYMRIKGKSHESKRDIRHLFIYYKEYWAWKNYQDHPEKPSDSDMTPKKVFGSVIGISDLKVKTIFKEKIGEWIHHSRDVERMNAKGQYIIRKLFSAYVGHPQQLPNGPIMQLLVDTNDYYYDNKMNAPEADRKKYSNIDEVKKTGIGAARVELNKRLEIKDEEEREIKDGDKKNVYIRAKLMRCICDHIACMTDRYAMEEYHKLYG